MVNQIYRQDDYDSEISFFQLHSINGDLFLLRINMVTVQLSDVVFLLRKNYSLSKKFLECQMLTY